MECRNIGQSGLRVSAVGLGCNNFGWRIDQKVAQSVVHKALDCGITLFDTADVYGQRGGSESALGAILGDRRKDIVLATKFGSAMDAEATLKGGARHYIVRAVEASLRRLKTDCIDLYQIHERDPLTPIEETLRALDDLIHQGKVRYIGCSNHSSWEVVRAHFVAEKCGTHHFISAQDEYSLVVRNAERELMPALQACGMGLIPYFPLASGLLTGKYKKGQQFPPDSRFSAISRLADRYFSEVNWTITEKLDQFCKAHNRSLIELAFGWLLAHPVVSSVIAGATKPEQVEANVKAAAWTLDPSDLATIDAIAKKD